THQIEQQFAITRLRAIETGRYVVVASPNGRSGVIAPDGRVVAAAPPRTMTVLNEQIGLASGMTPAVRLGTWPARCVMLVTVAGLAVALAQRRRRTVAGTGADQARPPRESPATVEKSPRCSTRH